MKRRIKLWVKWLCILLVLGITAVLGINAYLCHSVKGRIYHPDELLLKDFDCILVLGAGVRSDGTPSNMLEDRLLTAKELYDAGVSSYLLLSGDHGQKEYDEVNCMKEYMMQNGIPREPIFLDHAGFSTYESIYRAKEIFGAQKILIVTQKYHLYRALYLADALGLDAVGATADLRTYIGQSARETREIAARVKDFFFSITKPLPTYLGDPIPLEGSGEVTDG